MFYMIFQTGEKQVLQVTLTLVKSFLVGTFKSFGIMAITVEVRAVWKSFVSQEKVPRQSYSHVKIIRYVKQHGNFLAMKSTIIHVHCSYSKRC